MATFKVHEGIFGRVSFGSTQYTVCMDGAVFKKMSPMKLTLDMGEGGDPQERLDMLKRRRTDSPWGKYWDRLEALTAVKLRYYVDIIIQLSFDDPDCVLLNLEDMGISGLNLDDVTELCALYTDGKNAGKPSRSRDD